MIIHSQSSILLLPKPHIGWCSFCISMISCCWLVLNLHMPSLTKKTKWESNWTQKCFSFEKKNLFHQTLIFLLHLASEILPWHIKLNLYDSESWIPCFFRTCYFISILRFVEMTSYRSAFTLQEFCKEILDANNIFLHWNKWSIFRNLWLFMKYIYEQQFHALDYEITLQMFHKNEPNDTWI